MAYNRNQKGIRRLLTLNKGFAVESFVFETLIDLDQGTNLKKIVMLLCNNLNFSENEKKQLFQYHILHLLKIDAKQTQSFALRIQQTKNHHKGTINETMLFIMIYYGIDTSPNAIDRRAYLKETIEEEGKNMEKPLNEKFWKNLVEFSLNPFVTMPILLKVFDIIKHKLGITEWKQSNAMEYHPYSKAREIARIALEKHNVNLYEIHQKIVIQQTKILSCQKNKQHLKKFEQDFPYIQLLTAIQPLVVELKQYPQNLNILPEQFDRKTQEIMKKYKIKNVPKTITLLSRYIKINYENETAIYFQKQAFYEEIMNLGCFNKIFWLLESKNKIIPLQKQKMETSLYETIDRKFYKDCNSLCFDKKSSICTAFNDNILIPLTVKAFDSDNKIQQMFVKITTFADNFSIFNSTFDQGAYFMQALYLLFVSSNAFLNNKEIQQRDLRLNQQIQNIFSKFLITLKSIISLFDLLLRTGQKQNEENLRLFIESKIIAIENTSETNEKDFPMEVLIQYCYLRDQAVQKYKLKNIFKRKTFLKNAIKQLISKDQFKWQIRIRQSVFILKEYLMLSFYENDIPNEHVKLFLNVFIEELAHHKSLFITVELLPTASICYHLIKDVQGFFQTLGLMLKMIQRQGSFYENRKLFLCLETFTETYIKVSMPWLDVYWNVPLSLKLKRIFKTSHEQIISNSNFIFVIEKHFTFIFRYHNPISVKQMTHYLQLASYFINHCDFMFKRSFMSAMDCWIICLQSRNYFGLKEKKVSRLSIRYIRNPQYFHNSLKNFVMNKMKLNMNGSINSHHSSKQMILNKIEKILSIKLMKLTIDHSSIDIFAHFQQLR